MTANTIPRKRAVAEKTLVEDMAETVAPHGYKVVNHTVAYDHERDETKLTVKFVKANPNQTVLKLARGAQNGEEDES